jgi:hypothetical protein
MTAATLGPDPGFWSGKRVLLTGHTGFKGAWAALWLARMGTCSSWRVSPGGSIIASSTCATGRRWTLR